MVSGLPGVRLGRVAKPVGEDLSTEVEPVAIQHRQEVGKVATAHRTNQTLVTSKDAQVKQFICFTEISIMPSQSFLMPIKIILGGPCSFFTFNELYFLVSPWAVVSLERVWAVQQTLWRRKKVSKQSLQ